MSEPGNPSASLARGGRICDSTLDHLDDDPETQDDQGRDPHDPYEESERDQRQHRRVGIENEVGREDPRHGPAGPHHRYSGGWGYHGLREGSRDPRDQVESQKASVP